MRRKSRLVEGHGKVLSPHPWALAVEESEEIGAKVAVLLSLGQWPGAIDLLHEEAKKKGAAIRHEDPQVETDRRPIAELGLRVKIVNALEWHGFLFVGDLRELTAQEFLSWPNCGQKALAELRQALAEACERFMGDDGRCR